MILVTGSTGFVGRSLTNALTLAGIEWRGFNGRINNPTSLAEQLEGIHTVFHLAGAEARGRARLLAHIDIEGTERLLEQAERAGVGHLIFPSRIGADPKTWHPLLKTKGEVERLIQRSSIPYTILRTGSLFGKDDRFSEMVLGLAFWSWPFVWLPDDGELPMQPLWVEDYVRCLIICANQPEFMNKTISIAGDERLHYRDFVNQMLHTKGLSRIRMRLPLRMIRPLTTLFFSWWYWPPVSRFFIDRFFAPEVADLDAILRQFKFQPARFIDTIAYLNRSGMRWRLLRR